MQEIKTAFEWMKGERHETNEHLSQHNANTSIDFFPLLCRFPQAVMRSSINGNKLIKTVHKNVNESCFITIAEEKKVSD
jgi:hypothetical protein